jgi:hypothetical protein
VTYLPSGPVHMRHVIQVTAGCCGEEYPWCGAEATWVPNVEETQDPADATCIACLEAIEAFADRAAARLAALRAT